MRLIKALEIRKSTRAFKSDPVEKEKIDLLFEAAKWAPSSMNEQPWIFFYAVKSARGVIEAISLRHQVT